MKRLGATDSGHYRSIAQRIMRRSFGSTGIVIWVALVHCLLTFFVSPIGWEHLYRWDSPHWLRAVWASMFDLPLLIIFSPLFAFNAPPLIPLNSLVLSWMVIWPVEMFKTFRRSGRKRDLACASAGVGLSVALLGWVGAVWIPPNILSQEEVTIQMLHKMDAFSQQLGQTNNRPQKP